MLYEHGASVTLGVLTAERQLTEARMARQRRKRPSRTRKAKWQRRTQASYGHGLKDPIRKLLPGRGVPM